MQLRASAALFTLLCSVHAQELQTSQVHTPDGVLEGVISADGKVRTFKGIPYAAPPVGDLRWKPPQPPQPWTGVRKAVEYGARCMQGPIYSDMIFHDSGPSEDCLHLSLWMPAAVPAQTRLPVMVWIYGGGFAAGATSEPRQDGGQLSKKGILVVSMDYRLNIFGFFSHPELAKESRHNTSGNYGLMDQLAALQWVHKNIALFGGDPDNVTIFGESAGSFSVSALMASPLAQGLFQHAIGESGAFFSTTLPLRPRAEIEKADVIFAESALGTSSIVALRAKPAGEILQAALKLDTDRFTPIIDGHFLPKNVRAIYAAGKQSHIPLLAGWNADERSYTKIFKKQEPTAKNFGSRASSLFPGYVATFLKLYPGETDAQAKRSAQDLAGDQFIGYSTWKWLEMQRTTGKSPTFRYIFEQVPPADPAATPAESPGAYHSAEIEFVFNVLHHKKLPWGSEDRKLADLMSTYWSNFARTGDPNSPGLPRWPAYNSEDGFQVMHLGTNAHAEPDHHRARYEFLGTHASKQ
jgi:para-nitrobenzyl esterase